MNTKDVLIVLFIFLVCSKMVKAESRFYSDLKGNQIGSSYQMGSMTFYQDSKGNQVGSTSTMGNYTSYNKSDGTQIGSSVSMPFPNQRNNQPQPQPFFNGVQR
jgi:hypothetical protein